MVTVEVPVEPDVKLTDGVAAIVKSGDATVNMNVAFTEWVSEPLVALTMMTYVPAMFALQRIRAVPELRTLFGVIASQVRPVGTESVRLTVPTKPFNEPMMKLELTVEPTFEVAGGRAAIVKSMKLNVAVAECERELLVPVMARV